MSPASKLSATVTGTGPALLLAHGAGGGIELNYRPVLRFLESRFTVIGPDLPGSGATPRSARPLEIDDLADRLVAAAVDAGHGTFALCGYSLGASLAIRASARHPDRVTALVLTAGSATLDLPSRVRVEKWRSLLDGPRDVAARYLLSVMVSERYHRALTPAMADGLTELIALGMPSGSADQLDLLLRTDVSADLAGITVPTLVLGMAEDRLVSGGSVKALAAGVAGSRYAELDGGHATALESPLMWARAIQEFLLP